MRLICYSPMLPRWCLFRKWIRRYSLLLRLFKHRLHQKRDYDDRRRDHESESHGAHSRANQVSGIGPQSYGSEGHDHAELANRCNDPRSLCGERSHTLKQHDTEKGKDEPGEDGTKGEGDALWL